MSINVKINNIAADNKLKRVSFRNSIEGTPSIEIEPADVFWSEFDVGAIVSIYDGLTKLLEGEIKDITVNTGAGIVSKNARIHVKDLKEKIFSYDVSNVAFKKNKQCLTQMCVDAGVTFSSSTALLNSHQFAMELTGKSVPFYNIVQEICASECWGVYANHEKIFVKDLINDTSNTYSIYNLVNPVHKVNDLNCYGNVALKGNVLNDRLISEENPYLDLTFSSSQTIDDISITANNESDLISILNTSGNFSFSEDDKGREIFTLYRVNATTINNTFNPDTVSILNNSVNFTLQGYEIIPYIASDKIGNQCKAINLFGFVNNPDAEVKIIIETKAKKINSYTADKTPDRFFIVAKDTASTGNAKNNYLYYENRNIAKLEQLETMASELLRETGQRILTLEFKLYGTTVYKPLDRLYIYNTKDEYNGYWTAIDVRINKTADYMITEFKCIRANTAIIPALNIYVWDTILTKIKDISKQNYKAMFTDNNTFYDLKYDKVKNLVNPYNVKSNKGDIGFVTKLDKGKYQALSVSKKEYPLNENKLTKKNFSSAGTESYKGGWTPSFSSIWNSNASPTTTKKYNENTGTPFTITSVLSTYLGNEEAEIEITFSNDLDSSSISKDCLLILQ